MKCVSICLLVTYTVVMVLGQDIPTKSCPPGEHSVLYCPPKAEPTCDKPYLHAPEIPKPCDRPECFCNTGTIRDLKTKKCVEPQNCSLKKCFRK